MNADERTLAERVADQITHLEIAGWSGSLTVALLLEQQAEIERWSQQYAALLEGHGVLMDERDSLRRDMEELREAADKAITEFRWLGRSGLNFATLQRMGQLARKAHVAWCPWHKLDWQPATIGCPKCQDEVDLARARGEG